ncbi:hypothetical protein E2C01_009563 [Portunus trituberculatus]|uniref:Uncharacterized protein n=1 Tax=Portunus trituberculatus TaxID=210409 RepID=A0A5B7D646_PORTR|nr:hypothetical protein [Portunus trituberculatus]
MRGVNEGTSETWGKLSEKEVVAASCYPSFTAKQHIIYLLHPAFHLLPTMGQMSKRNKQRKDAWNMSVEAQRIKKSVLNLTPQILQYTSSCHPPPPSSRPPPPPHHISRRTMTMK